PLQLVQYSAKQHSTGGPDRMAEGNRATVDVDLIRVNLQVAHGLKRYHGEGFVDLPQVNILYAHAGLVQRLAAGWRGGGGHDHGLCSHGGQTAHASAWPQPVGTRVLGRGDQDCPRTVDNAAGVAGMVYVLDRPSLGIHAQRHFVEAFPVVWTLGAQSLEGGF